MTENKRDPKRIRRIMDLLETIWEENPDMRFFQLMEMLQHKYSSKNNNIGKREAMEKDSKGYENPVSFIDLFYLQDDSFEEFLRGYVTEDHQKSSEITFWEILGSDDTSKLIEYVKEHDVNQEIKGASLLYWVVFLDKDSMVTKLLELGADPNKLDFNGRSPLEIAAYYNYFATCRELLKYGAKISENAVWRAEVGWNEKTQKRIVKLFQEWEK
ncbi:ankyrin repeat domain-containing protein [Ornithinibacillus contaminans]|uniref:ankyrin repeat domain-containing protein n=1 Tax=Ornithinibacillus contaminans TaxID=694055 RepID=UPI00064DA398|nr:ankyrin repeat domain-containing protein [Ornithinibacillus contaminans]